MINSFIPIYTPGPRWVTPLPPIRKIHKDLEAESIFLSQYWTKFIGTGNTLGQLEVEVKYKQGGYSELMLGVIKGYGRYGRIAVASRNANEGESFNSDYIDKLLEALGVTDWVFMFDGRHHYLMCEYKQFELHRLNSLDTLSCLLSIPVYSVSFKYYNHTGEMYSNTPCAFLAASENYTATVLTERIN